MRLPKSTLKKSSGVLAVCLLALVSLLAGLSPGGGLSAAWAAQPEPFLTWSGDSRTTQTITWLMPADCPEAKVQYLKESSFTGGFEEAGEAAGTARNFGSSGTDKLYSANLTGLTAGSKYVYRVGTEGNWSETRSFTTAPADTGGFSFLYLGDAHFGYDDAVPAVWEDLRAEAAANYPDLRFALQGGDLTDNDNEEEYRQFIGVAGGLFSRIPFMPAKGNHDGSFFTNVFKLPSSGLANFYSFDYGDAHFTVLDSGQNALPAAINWLRNDLQNSNSKWKFVIFHHPAYYVFNDGKTSICDSIREKWAPLFEENNVDLAFVGHQHMYARTKPMQDRTDLEAGQDLVYIMGVSGTKLYRPNAGFDYNEKIVADVSNYQIINIDGETLTLRSVAADGQVLDTYRIKKNAASVRVNGVSLDKSTGSIAVGGTTQLTATVSPADADNQEVIWESSDEDVATVSDEGLVTGVGAGTATITVTSVDGGYTAICQITVVKTTEPVSLTVLPATIVQGHLSYIHIAYSGTVLQEAYFALLDKNGDIVDSAMQGSKGKAIITVTAPSEPGHYDVVALLEGDQLTGDTIEVVAYNDNIWETYTSIDGNGFVVINFNEDITTKNNSLTVNGEKATGRIVDGRSIVTSVNVESLSDGESQFSVSGVKYPRLYPGYVFTFTTIIIK